MDHAVSVSQVTHVYGEKQVLNQVSFNIGVGEIFGLLGPSGAGKTTIIQILTGQLKQTSGKAQLLQEDTLALTDETHRRMGLMLDNLGLYERLTCYDNLNLIAKLYGLDRDIVNDVLEQVELKDASNMPVLKLSKGMKQRLLFARAIMGKPDLLFLDEPTSGLDPGTASQIHNLIREQQQRGATVFLTTHNMEEASKLCHFVGLLHKGNLVEYGSPIDLCNQYNHQRQLHLTLTTGEIVKIPNVPASGNIVKEYIEKGLLLTIHSSEPNLETVFMELTGRGLE